MEPGGNQKRVPRGAARGRGVTGETGTAPEGMFIGRDGTTSYATLYGSCGNGGWYRTEGSLRRSEVGSSDSARPENAV